MNTSQYTTIAEKIVNKDGHECVLAEAGDFCNFKPDLLQKCYFVVSCNLMCAWEEDKNAARPPTV